MNKVISTHSFASLHNPSNDACTVKSELTWFIFALLLTMLGLPVSAYALHRSQADEIPHVNQQARDNFVQYIYAENYKAFAIAPGGSWAWTESKMSTGEARISALQRCQQRTEQTCVLYSLNDEVVFDSETWPTLWRTKQQKENTIGVTRGDYFPNLRFSDKHGKQYSLKDFKEKITLVHFWGTWCSHCLRELPVLLKMQTTLIQKHGNKIAMILLQIREPFNTSLNWAIQHQLDELPLYDSGVNGNDDAVLKTLNGKSYPDQEIAMVFPTSYILDRKGKVLFSHKGPIADWYEYLPFFKDIVDNETY